MMNVTGAVSDLNQVIKIYLRLYAREKCEVCASANCRTWNKRFNYIRRYGIAWCVKRFVTYVRKYSGNVNWFKMLSRGRTTCAN